MRSSSFRLADGHSSGWEIPTEASAADSRVDGGIASYPISKYLNPDHYESGKSAGDDQSMYCGFDQDTIRWTVRGLGLYGRDRAGVDTQGFGSPHANGAQFVLCDGSVRTFAYSIDNVTYDRLANREDNEILVDEAL